MSGKGRGAHAKAANEWMHKEKNVPAIEKYGWSIGAGAPLSVIAGVNVLEDIDLALTIGTALKEICTSLALPFAFKASFDKANRSSLASYRGPGLDEGLAQLREVKRQLGVPVCTDIHEPHQADRVAGVAEILQIPAFLCRQTDLVRAVARASRNNDRLIHVKKAQFMAPWDCRNVIDKVKEEAGDASRLILCERGSSFGYNNLVVDMLGVHELKKLGAPVTIDATHAVQLPGADPRTKGASTGGRRDGVAIIAKAAVAVGADGVFLEFHTDPDKALCDGPSCLPISSAKPLLETLKSLHGIVTAPEPA